MEWGRHILFLLWTLIITFLYVFFFWLICPEYVVTLCYCSVAFQFFCFVLHLSDGKQVKNKCVVMWGQDFIQPIVGYQSPVFLCGCLKKNVIKNILPSSHTMQRFRVLQPLVTPACLQSTIWMHQEGSPGCTHLTASLPQASAKLPLWKHQILLACQKIDDSWQLVLLLQEVNSCSLGTPLKSTVMQALTG